MTVAIGLVCSDGVIVASDSMASSGNTARPICKVFAVPELGVVWTAAGAVFVIEEVEAVVLKEARENRVQAICRAPDLAGVRTALAPKITDKMKQCYGAALPFGINSSLSSTVPQHPFNSDFLLLGWSRDTPWFLEVSHDGQLNWHTSNGFAAVGSGGEFASVAQGLMKHYVEGRELSVDDGLLVAYRTIETTCEVSSHHVGLPVWLAVSTASGARVLERAEIDEIRDTVLGWKQLERETLAALRTPTVEDATDTVPVLPPDV
jgi:20S proteasome alpha/beta subunit